MSDSHAGVFRPAEVAGLTRARLRLPPLHLSDLAGEIAAILILTPLFLYAAAWNGFPFLFFDSGAYVLEGFAKVFVPERSPVYSLFLHAVQGRADMWYVAWAQSALTAFAIVEFSRALWPRTTLWKLLGVCAALSILTSIAWFVGQIEPDCFTAVLVLTMYPLAFRLRKVGWARALLLVPVAGFASAAHPSHLGLSAGLVLVVLAARIAATIRPKLRLPRPNLIVPALAFGIGVGMVLVANYSLTKQVFVSRSGVVFLTARLMGEGVIGPTLDELCPTRHFKLCAYKDHLPQTADEYLWAPYSPFNRLGRFYGDREEYATLAAEGLKRYPLRAAALGLWGSFRQYFMFRTGDGVEPQEWVLGPLFRGFMPKQYKHYLAARQQRGLLSWPAVNVVQYPFALLAQVWLGVVMWRAALRRRWNVASLPAFVLVALIGNALVCGLFSGPHDRYQSRLAWVPCLIVLLTARQTVERALRRPIESGT
ncbi:MAG TPA: hypothetical protein VMU01_07495 [Rhizomicrobium sp.]|nr:hypothetical protein [Rhizomicrobium sp.]